MKRQAITRQRSAWVCCDIFSLPGIEEGDVIAAKVWRRSVSDGELCAFVADEPGIGWHLSISYRNHRGEYSRYPTWDELAHARYELLPGDLDFVMHLPPQQDYVALHPSTFHLHQHPEPGPA